MKLRGVLNHRLQMRAKAPVIRMLAKTIEKLPFLALKDQFAAIDYAVRTAYYLRDLIDAQGVIDSVRAFAVGKGLIDTVSTPTDSFVKSASKGLSDSQSLADALSRQVDYLRGLADLVTERETVAKSTGKSAADSFSTSDSLSRTIGFTRTYSDSQSAADAASLATGKALADQVTSVLDALTRSMLYRRTYADSLGTGDALTTKAVGKAPSDGVAGSESITSFSVSKPTTDSFGLTENTLISMGFTRGFSEASDYADPTYFVSMADYVSGSVSPNDVLTKTVFKSPTEQITVLESCSKVLARGAFFSESISATASLGISYEKTLSESVSPAEAFSRTAQFLRVLGAEYYVETGYMLTPDDYVTVPAGVVPADHFAYTIP